MRHPEHHKRHRSGSDRSTSGGKRES
jgi:hypothetical protein